MATTVQKICCVCGNDVSHVKRTKDVQGNYYCAPCYVQAIADKQVPVYSVATVGSNEAKEKPIDTQPELDPLESLGVHVGQTAKHIVAAPPSPSILATGNQPEEHVESKGLTAFEKYLIAGGTIVGLLVIGFTLYFTVFRDRWENENRQALTTMSKEGETLAKAGKLIEAKIKYDELFQLLGGHKVRDTSLYDELTKAHDAAERLPASIAASELARVHDDQVLATQRAESERQEQEAERLRQEAMRADQALLEKRRLQPAIDALTRYATVSYNKAGHEANVQMWQEHRVLAGRAGMTRDEVHAIQQTEQELALALSANETKLAIIQEVKKCRLNT